MKNFSSWNVLRVGPAKLAVFCLTSGLVVLLAVTVGGALEAPSRLAVQSGSHAIDDELIARSGVRNPVTAVLLNFRAFDTLLELAVLILAVLAVFAAAGGEPERPSSVDAWKHSRLLTATLGIVVPVSLIVAGDLLWMGADHPGGAFQAGAVLSGAAIMLVLADRLNNRFLPDWRFRLGVVAGVAVFLGVGVSVILAGQMLLQYPVEYAKRLILAVETAAMASVAVVFLVLFDAVARPLRFGNRQGTLPQMEEAQ